MKTFIFFLFCLSVLNIYSQKKISSSIYIDPKMAIMGPYKNDKKSALDIIYRLYISNNKHEYGVDIEYFKRINYFAPAIFYSKKILKFKKTSISSGVNIGYIFRTKNYNTKTPTFAINGRINRKLTHKTSISLLANLKYRSDLIKLYKSKNTLYFNGYIGLNYNIL